MEGGGRVRGRREGEREEIEGMEGGGRVRGRRGSGGRRGVRGERECERREEGEMRVRLVDLWL